MHVRLEEGIFCARAKAKVEVEDLVFARWPMSQNIAKRSRELWIGFDEGRGVWRIDRLQYSHDDVPAFVLAQVCIVARPTRGTQPAREIGLASVSLKGLCRDFHDTGIDAVRTDVLSVEDLVDIDPSIANLDGNEVGGQERAGENQKDEGRSEHAETPDCHGFPHAFPSRVMFPKQ